MSASINIVDIMEALQRRNTAKVREYSRRSRQECCFDVFDFDLLCVDRRMIAGVVSYSGLCYWSIEMAIVCAHGCDNCCIDRCTECIMTLPSGLLVRYFDICLPMNAMESNECHADDK